MRKLSLYLGFALAACLSCFSLSALAQPVSYAFRSVQMLAELPSVGMKRLELTLAMWRTGSDSTDESLKSNLRASSNHFVMVSAEPNVHSTGVGPGLALG